MSFLKFSPKVLVIMSLVLVLSLSAGYITLAWTEPTGTMPVTVAAPLNTGGVAQTKTGALALTGNLTASSLIDFNNNNYYVDPSGQTVLAGLQAKNSTGNLVTRFEGLSNSYSSKLYLSSTSSGDGGMYYDASQNLMNIFSYGNLRFNVGTGNLSGAIANERMVINQAGNIGIGTAAPATRLHVLQSSYNYQDSIVESALPSVRLVDNENGQSSFGFLADGSNLYLDAYTYANRFTNSYGSHILTVDPSGNIIIANNLNVGGNQTIAGNFTVSGNICVGTSCVDVTTWNKMIYAGTGGGKQKFTSSGTFTVPVGVMTIWVSISGGGGGGGEGSGSGTSYHVGNNGSIGGTSSFGSFVSVAGGGGGYSGGNGAAGGAGGSPGGYNGSPGSRGGLMSGGNGGAGGGTLSGYGFGGAGGVGENEIWCCQSSGGTGGGGGGGGATVMTQEIIVSAGQVIPVTVGAGGAGATAGSPGFCLVEW